MSPPFIFLVAAERNAMSAFKYVAAVTVCAVLFVGFFLLLQTSYDVQAGTSPTLKLLIGILVGLLPAAALAGAFTKDFEVERFVGRVVLIAALGAGIGWLAARGILAIAVLFH
jgi:hypothetical protein